MTEHNREQPRTILLTLGRTGRLAGVRNPYTTQSSCTFLPPWGMIQEGKGRSLAVSAVDLMCQRGMA